jgi:hypothetical protein
VKRTSTIAEQTDRERSAYFGAAVPITCPHGCGVRKRVRTILDKEKQTMALDKLRLDGHFVERHGRTEVTLNRNGMKHHYLESSEVAICE